MAASAFAVESANIVGYQQTTCIAGLNFIAPDFTQVGANTVKVGDITLSGDAVTSAADNLQILDADGNAVSGYTWSLDGDFGDDDGWYNDSMEFAATEVISRGLSMLLSCENDDVVVQVKGEVNTNRIELVSVAGLNCVGNFFPASIPVGNITLSGDAVTSAADNLQILDADGNAVSGYTWSLDGDFGDDDGWYNDSMEFAADELIPAGLGMLLSCENDDVEVAIDFTL